jgi:hypothetical protein
MKFLQSLEAFASHWALCLICKHGFCPSIRKHIPWISSTSEFCVSEPDDTSFTLNTVDLDCVQTLEMVLTILNSNFSFLVINVV